MDKRALGMLSLAIVVMAMLAYLGARPSIDETGAAGQRVLPDLKASLDEVTAVHLQGLQMDTHLLRRDGVWQVQERDGYRADMAKLMPLLRASAEMVFLEPKTANPERLSQLGLAAITVPDSQALGMSLSTGEVPAGSKAADYKTANHKSWSVLVGKQPAERDGQYLRLADDAQAWLVDKPLALSADPGSWLAPVILNIDAELVTGIVLGGEGPGRVEIDSAADPAQPIDNARIVNLPQGKALTYPGVADEVTRALVNLRLQDIQPFAAVDWEGAITAQFELGHDRTLLLRGIEKDGEYWLAVTMGSLFSDADRVTFGLGDDVERWAYKVGRYHYELLARSMIDFVQEPVEEPNNRNES
jgi:hypothetical protein